MEGISVLGNSL